MPLAMYSRFIVRFRFSLKLFTQLGGKKINEQHSPLSQTRFYICRYFSVDELTYLSLSMFKYKLVRCKKNSTTFYHSHFVFYYFHQVGSCD